MIIQKNWVTRDKMGDGETQCVCRSGRAKKLPPGALLFTDDRAENRAENIEMARARGWATHHFDGAAGLAARLVADRILTEEEAR